MRYTPPNPTLAPDGPALGAEVPTLVFDGDCAICTTTAELVTRRLRRDPGDFAVRAYQDLDLAALGLTEADCEAAIQWVDANGRIAAAQNAAARTLLCARWWARPLGAVLLLPGVNQVAGLLYRWVARNRHRLPGGTPACAMPTSDRPV